MHVTAKDFFREGQEKLAQASNELNRPEEDVVTYLVCQNSHVAIENYLKGFLLDHSIDPSNYSGIDGLYEKCKSVNPKFEEINLSGLKCEADKQQSAYCDSTQKVSRCFELADKLDGFFRRENLLS